MKLDMNTHEASSREQLSGLFDGELDSAQLRPLVDACAQDSELMNTWASYSLIGDAMRQAGQTRGQPRAQTSPTLTHTSSVPAHAALQSTAHAAAQAVSVNSALAQDAANDSVFRWKMVAGIAGLAAVGALVWSAVGANLGSSGPQLAQSQTPSSVTASATPATPAAPALVATAIGTDSGSISTAAPTTTPAQLGGDTRIMIRDPRLDELMAAHRQFGTASALGQPAGILRATFSTGGKSSAEASRP
jgi:sigma-E factor negative regulatory protein RseA